MSEGWSGRRGSNPRPTAWKAVTLPLSYSRLRVPLPHCLARLGEASPPTRLVASPVRRGKRARAPRSSRSETCRPPPRLTFRDVRVADRPPLPSRSASAGLPSRSSRQRAKAGGEGRTRTFEAARATDLQSAAFDRFATSPTMCIWKRVLGCSYVCRWSWRRDLNPRPADYKSAALPD